MSIPSDIPAYRLPGANRRVTLVRRPAGIPHPDDFSLETAAVPAPGPGQILVRNVYLSVDPAQRGWASDVGNYASPVALGDTMRALAVGVVVHSNDREIPEGIFLYGWFGWQDYAVVGRDAVLREAQEDIPLSAHAGLLGINGLTAYIALTELGRPKVGETLLVSTAAGAVGSLVGQLGARLGCRTIALTGTAEKVERCRTRFKYDVALDYHSTDLSYLLADAAPDGIDVFFDNTGGVIQDAVMPRMRVAGRVIQCGTASTATWTPPPIGPRKEREVLTKRLIWSGFVIFDHIGSFSEAARILAHAYRAGELTYDEDITDRIEEAPQALRALYSGENRGKRLIYVG